MTKQARDTGFFIRFQSGTENRLSHKRVAVSMAQNKVVGQNHRRTEDNQYRPFLLHEGVMNTFSGVDVGPEEFLFGRDART